MFYTTGDNDTGTWDLSSLRWQPTRDLARLVRYFNPSVQAHWVSTGPVAAGWNEEAAELGSLYLTPRAGTQPLYDCVAGGFSGNDRFLSKQSDCETHFPQGVNGYIYTSPPSGVPTLQIYRCYNPFAHEHFVLADPACEGLTTEMSLGYSVAAAPLVRYINGTSHRVTTGSQPFVQAYKEETSGLGALRTTAAAGTQALYECLSGSSDQFISTASNCEGNTVLRVAGYSYTSAPAGVASKRIYRCSTYMDHFVSPQSNCEGATVEGSLGIRWTSSNLGTPATVRPTGSCVQLGRVNESP